MRLIALSGREVIDGERDGHAKPLASCKAMMGERHV